MKFIKRNLIPLFFTVVCCISYFFYIYSDRTINVLPIGQLNISEGYWDIKPTSRSSTTAMFSLKTDAEVICCFKFLYDHKLFSNLNGEKVIIYWQFYENKYFDFLSDNLVLEVFKVNDDGTKKRIINYQNSKKKIIRWGSSNFSATWFFVGSIFFIFLIIVSSEKRHRKLNNGNK